MSAAFGDDDFYQNLLQYMNQSTTPQGNVLYTTPPSFSPHEAEKHSLDDDSVMDEGESKRRESTNSQAMDSGSDEPDSKPKKKPGRKMMMTEPANKRKAQNRAAQRAFRERKEAHVKGLETRVTELEELTQNKDAENENLKNQVQALQTELMALKGGNFDFDFGMKNVQNSNALTNNNTAVRNPFQNDKTNAQRSSPSPSSGSISDGSSLLRSGQTSLATSPENDGNKNGTPNIDIPFDLFTNSAGPVNFNTSNSTSPLFTNDVFGATTQKTAPLFGQNRASPILDTFARTLDSLQGSHTSPNLFANGFNSSMPSTSTNTMSSFTPNSTNSGNIFNSTNTGNLFDMNDPLFNTWRDNSISSQGETSGQDFDIFDTMFSSMSPGAFNLVDGTGLTDFITDSPLQVDVGDQMVSCPELWEKVKNHPQFEDIDIDNLCSEMKAKAKCSTTGPLVSARLVDETINRFVKSTQ